MNSKTDSEFSDDLRINKFFPELRDSRILIHVPFHFTEDRFQYLKTVLKSISEYKFKNIDVVVDTNTEETLRLFHGYTCPENMSIDIKVHSNLDHPFLLTWAHRESMYINPENYDYFMYLEDDLMVSWDVVSKWREDSIKLYPFGYIRGFVRTEQTRDGIIVATDFNIESREDRIIIINGDTYLYPTNPYHGFWIYSKFQMKEFVASPCWIDGNCGWEVRERAAAGMIWFKKKKHRTVIPVDEHNGIPYSACVPHLPNNYANNPESPFGKIPLEELLPRKITLDSSFPARFLKKFLIKPRN